MKKILLRACCVALIVSTFAFCGNANCSAAASAKQQTLEEQLEEIDAQLQNLEKQGKESQAYLNALNQRISLLETKYQQNKDLVQATREETNRIRQQIPQTEESIDQTAADIAEKQKEVDRLTKDFEGTYKQYATRMRALYISGGNISKYAALLESNGIQDFLTRLEMVNRVSKRDASLLASVKQQTEKIVAEKEQLETRQAELKDKQKELGNQKESLRAFQTELTAKEKTLVSEEKSLAAEQRKTDQKVLDIAKETERYGELRAMTAAELAEIDDDIAAADRKYAETTTKATTTTETTKKHTTTSKNTSHNNTETTQKEHTTHRTTTKQHATQRHTLSLTYPCPAYRTITCGFGAYPGHTGCDFSTAGRVNQRIVAAESGTVIVSKDLTNGDGSYRSYGRYIVIRHDKTTTSGEPVYTLYAHNNQRLVYEGQHVKKGQQIALSGSTGNSTGPHCHFEVRVGGSSQSYAVNPQHYLH